MSQLNCALTVSFEVFTQEFKLYPKAAFDTFHIVRDIMIKQEVQGVTIHDGFEYGFDGYLIRCVSKVTQCNRVIVPYAADQEIDLLRCVMLYSYDLLHS